jgi:dienelactone hydrolase
MIERDVNVTSRNGAIPSFAVCPDGPGAYPGIILYMDAPGIREELRNLARRIAKHGYFCLLPDMYYRIGALRFDFVRRAEGMRQTMFAAMNSHERAGHRRYRGLARLSRYAGQGEARRRRRHRLLYEWALRDHRSGAIS